MNRQVIRFGLIGCGLMGKEFASAAGRWRHLLNLNFEPAIVAACDLNPAALEWFKDNVPGLRLATTDPQELINHPDVEAVYCAVPHDQHERIYLDVLRAGKHLLGEKPFGIDARANAAILQGVRDHPELLARCTSQFPYFPGAYRIAQWVAENRFGKIIEVEAGFWHSSDLDPRKAINWKRMIAVNGEYGCMGDLGMHVLHLPLRFGWRPARLKSYLSKIVRERQDAHGQLVPCETWDNAILGCEVRACPERSERIGDQEFPMFLSFKRIAPGHANTWFIKIYGTALSAEFSTKNPKQLTYMPYSPGSVQEWRVLDMPYQSAYPAITGSIFEFGFSDAILQMWAAYCDELVHGRAGMRQPLYTATPEETELSHRLFSAALESQKTGQTLGI
jgi:predicted dehydrogenase